LSTVAWPSWIVAEHHGNPRSVVVRSPVVSLKPDLNGSPVGRARDLAWRTQPFLLESANRVQRLTLLPQARRFDGRGGGVFHSRRRCHSSLACTPATQKPRGGSMSRGRDPLWVWAIRRRKGAPRRARLPRRVGRTLRTGLTNTPVPCAVWGLQGRGGRMGSPKPRDRLFFGGGRNRRNVCLAASLDGWNLVDLSRWPGPATMGHWLT